MLQRNPLDAISYAFGNASLGSRPLPLIALYSAAYLGGFHAEQVVKFFPLALGPLLVISSFFFVQKGIGNESLAGVSALLTAFSFNITVGMWASYYANWLAMAEAYLFSAFLLVYSRSRSVKSLLALTGLSLALVFTHPWTWGLITSVGIVIALVNWRKLKDRSLIGPAVALVIVGLVADILKSQFYGSTTLAADVSTKAPVFGRTQLSMFWPNTVEGVLVTYGGLLANSMLLALALISVLVMVKLRNAFELFLVSWVASVSVPFLFFDSFHQTRLLYDMPVPVLSSLGLVFVTSKIGEKRLHSFLILIFVLMFNANYAISAIAQI